MLRSADEGMILGRLQYYSNTWALDPRFMKRIKEKEEQKHFSLCFLSNTELLHPNSG